MWPNLPAIMKRLGSAPEGEAAQGVFTGSPAVRDDWRASDTLTFF